MGQWNSTPSEIHEDEPFLLYKEQLQQERMMELQNQWLERTNAMEIAWSREFVRYYGAFCAVSTVGLCVGAFQRRRLVLLAPLVPLGCVLTYQLDQVYGTLRGRVRGETAPSVLLPRVGGRETHGVRASQTGPTRRAPDLPGPRGHP
ncbi:plasminogen receptor (KT) isoform X5 [Gadus morhua]|uniref:plasminogen receptor (KT) isoform X5 n=1 Tax=Gadus morhua TaxID=8049 RepID=UPI0011B7AD0A|nr:plasminogen receptor (KT) isoform X5 [Gadus morhua]